MEELVVQIRRIQEKMLLLQKQYQHLQREQERAQLQAQLYLDKDKLQQHRINELERQLELSRASRPQMSEQDRQAMEKRINQYIREIDKCIALLNE